MQVSEEAGVFFALVENPFQGVDSTLVLILVVVEFFPNIAANCSMSNLDRNNCWTDIDIDNGYCNINAW